MAAPILNLSTDVALLIFDFLIQVDRNSKESRPILTPIKLQSALLAALRLTRVCQHWRQILIECPVIWAKVINIDLLHTIDEALVHTIMARTKSAPLFVQGHERFQLDDNRQVLNSSLWSFIQKHWSRIRSLDVVVNGAELHLKIYNLACQAPTRIENFCLAGEFPRHLSTPILFPENAPLLRRCVDGPYRMNLTAPWLMQLREVHMMPASNSYDPSLEQVYSLTDLCAALAQMCNLEYLSLHCGGLKMSNILSMDGEQVWLPKLRRFVITGSVNECRLVLSPLAFPSSCTLCVKASIYSGEVTDEDFRRVAACFSQQFRSYAKIHQISALCISLGFNTFSVFSPTQTQSFFLDAIDNDLDGIELQSWYCRYNGDLKDVLPSICPKESTSEVTTLHLITFPRTLEEVFSQKVQRGTLAEFDELIFKGFPNLTKLITNHFFVEHLLRVEASAEILPKLTTLIISGPNESRSLISNARSLFEKWREGLGLPPVGVIELYDPSLTISEGLL